MTEMRVAAGLDGVIVADTELGGVRGEEGFFHYRQYSATDLARRRSLEDVWHLLHHGSLPEAGASDSFIGQVAARRAVDPGVAELIAGAARLGVGRPSLLWVRTAASLLAQSLGTESWITDRLGVAGQAEGLIAGLPTAIALGHRAQQGLAPLPPDPDLGLAADFLRMLGGDAVDERPARAFEQYLILTVDHGLNASTFTTRTVASTGADVGSAVVAGIGALSGPLHGGAPSLALQMLQEIGSVERAPAFIRARLQAGELLMGFGHRVYRSEDPRAALLREIAEGFDDPLVELAAEVERIAVRELARHRPERRLRANVEYYAGVVLHLVGVPVELFPACFAISRTIGWTAHVLEQIAANRIIRPKAAYVGPPPPVPVP